LATRAQDFGLAGGAWTLKLELTQHSGSFKVRGAFANLLTRNVPILLQKSSRRSA
jgi:threonine dehydratase